MKVSAEISFYPLRSEELGPSIEAFVTALEENGLYGETGAMSSLVVGEFEQVWSGLGEAFAEAAERDEAVMVLKLSNACVKDE